jgi:hypothetical protein
MDIKEELTEWVKSYKDIAERNALAETPQDGIGISVAIFLCFLQKHHKKVLII